MREDDPQKNFLSTRDAAELLSVDVSTVIHWVDKGKIPAHRTLGGHRRIHREDLVVFLKTHRMPVPASLSPRGPVVLVVDDEALVRLDIFQILQMRQDFHIHEADDGFKAGRLLERLKPDLVILDLKLPGLDGFEVCRSIRQDDRLSHTRILAVTGADVPRSRRAILEAGADAFIAKPFQPNDLLVRVEEVLSGEARR